MDNQKTCRHCSIVFTKLPKTSYKQWSRQFCCSKECGDKSKKIPWLEKFQMKPGDMRGFRTRFTKGHGVGDKNVNWKGEDAGYFAKHIWAGKWWGKPQFCEKCKCSDRRTYHWANISDTYQRDRNDWLRLCVSCHKNYDNAKKK